MLQVQQSPQNTPDTIFQGPFWQKLAFDHGFFNGMILPTFIKYISDII